jgi:hypothetical protein
MKTVTDGAAQVAQDAFHSVSQVISGNVLECAFVCQGVDLHTGNGAGRVFGAEEKSQCATPGTQIADSGVFGKTDKITQQGRIGAEGKCTGGNIQFVVVLEYFHLVLLLKNQPAPQ